MIDSATMRRLRMLLTLLLCLTIPVSGMASVLSGHLCPQRGEQGAGVVASDHSHRGAEWAEAGDESPGHDHKHCGDSTSHSKPCNGDHCACGCGFGACSPSASLVTPFSTLLAAYAGSQAVLSIDKAPHAGARGTSPLRPPIA